MNELIEDISQVTDDTVDMMKLPKPVIKARRPTQNLVVPIKRIQNLGIDTPELTSGRQLGHTR